MTPEQRIERLHAELRRRFRAAGHGSVQRVQALLGLSDAYFRVQRQRKRLDLVVLLGALEALDVDAAEFFAAAWGNADPVASFQAEAAVLRRQARRLPRILVLEQQRDAEDTEGGVEFDLEALDARRDENPRWLNPPSPAHGGTERRLSPTRHRWTPSRISVAVPDSQKKEQQQLTCKTKVRRHLFRSTVFFDLLRRKSRQEGRKSRQRGIELAKLVLVSLERSDEVFEERVHDLRALSWAWLGNAYRLALDFSAAVAAFEQADRTWSTPRANQDLSVLAHICIRKSALRLMRREYGEATQDVNRSCSLFRQSDQIRNEAQALIKRATIHIYACKLGEAVEDLREAAGLIDEADEKELAFAIRGNLANALVRAGQRKSAAKELERARQISRSIDDPLGTMKLDWIDGDLSELHGDLEGAKRFYASVRTGFIDADESRYFGMVSVDLMTIHSQQGEWEEVGKLASETLPILGSMKLHSETVAAVNLLAEAVEAESLSRRLLKDLRVALRQDPLTL